MRVIVTGGRGFLGSHIVDELEHREHDTVAPTHEELNLLYPAMLESYLHSAKPNVIVHAAAAVGGIGANVAEPGRFFHDNILMGFNLLEQARRYERQTGAEIKVLTIGTACMYPEDAATMYESELWNGKPAPETAAYAFAKRAVLEMGQAYREEYGLNATMVIPTNLYGPRDNFDLETGHVIPAMIRRFEEAKTSVVLWGTGKATRDFLYVEDAARGIVDAVEMYNAPEPINLGTGSDFSIKELAERIAMLTGFEGKIQWDASKPSGTPRRRMSVTRAAEVLGWFSHIHLGDGLKRTIDWYQENAA